MKTKLNVVFHHRISWHHSYKKRNFLIEISLIVGEVHDFMTDIEDALEKFDCKNDERYKELVKTVEDLDAQADSMDSSSMSLAEIINFQKERYGTSFFPSDNWVNSSAAV